MLKSYIESTSLSTDAFAEDVMPIGTIVSARACERWICVEKCYMKEPYGILLNDVVDKDLTKCHLNSYQGEIQKGGKVLVMHAGIVVTSNIDSSFKNTEILTSIYIDLRNGKFTTRKHKFTSDKVAKTLSRIDNQGYIKIQVNFQ